MSESELPAVVLAQSGNYSVVQVSDRRYPAIAVQGDSLKVLHEAVEELATCLRAGDLEEAEFPLMEIQETITSLKLLYEETLTKAGIQLPYVN
ncbi:DUF6959 family protein [Streptomyces exfoliatus]|uniref:DUF6959 family protein n=1 Tax=Streptomyces exfoliatus TaxID=1905 RepID=UPI00378A85AA